MEELLLCITLNKRLTHKNAVKLPTRYFTSVFCVSAQSAAIRCCVDAGTYEIENMGCTDDVSRCLASSASDVNPFCI